MSSVTIPTVEYAELVRTANAYRALVNDLWPVVIIFLILAFAEAIAFVYWWWRCRTTEEELACIESGNANIILKEEKLKKRISVLRRSRAHSKPGRKK